MNLYENPDAWTYIAAGYTLCIAGIGAYVVALKVRGRRLAKRVPAEERRWLS